MDSELTLKDLSIVYLHNYAHIHRIRCIKNFFL
ncbi:hypothetical protein ERICII_01523 [Paenibacillus larvae subsp. larvae DSM 25430]|nr:hypothetical protein ERICII_01523 [Paenibacillus larvae subsp. larvae DSM 25430]